MAETPYTFRIDGAWRVWENTLAGRVTTLTRDITQGDRITLADLAAPTSGDLILAGEPSSIILGDSCQNAKAGEEVIFFARSATFYLELYDKLARMKEDN